jgi:hypothetical protein
MSVTVFHGDASQYGLLTSAMAGGTMCGALLSARRPVPGMVLMAVSAAAFGITLALAAVMPGPLLFAATLFFVGLAALTFMTASNSMMQLTTERAMRGRVLALRIAVVMGGTPLGAPLVGWVVDRFGARWALGIGALSGIAAAAVAAGYLVRHRGLRLSRVAGRLRLVIGAAAADKTPRSRGGGGARDIGRDVPGPRLRFAAASSLVERVVDQHHALRCEQHLRSQRDLLRTQALEAVEGFLRHRDVVGQQEAGIALEHLLADRRAFPVHHEQLVVVGQFLHQPLEAHRAHRDA